MSKHNKKFPFEERYNHLTKNFNLDPFDALREIENNRDNFNKVQQQQKREHLASSN